MIIQGLQNALKDSIRGLAARKITFSPKALQSIALIADGDLRKGLNLLETLALSIPVGGTLSQEKVLQSAQNQKIHYSSQDQHYDTLSAFIKSIRGNDPDTTQYWLAKMLIIGEEPRFIARRLIIATSKDIGLVDSRVLTLATAIDEACEFIGQPECAINLAHCTIFLATSLKINRSYLAPKEAKKSIAKK